MSVKYFFIFSVLMIAGCTSTPPIINDHIIPQPQYVSSTGELSDINELTFSNDKDLAEYSDWIKKWGATTITDNINTHNIVLTKNSDTTAGYTVDINAKKVDITYAAKSDLRDALATLLQLRSLNKGKLPVINIKDSAAFAYRGMHLDVARHMFSVAEIKQYIDYLTIYKFNTFHWHLTEDQGWRIEIKKYPKLQEISAYRDETLIGHYNDQPHRYDGKKYGGYYTQEEIKDIVAYATARGIDVIPEIDIPGHTSAVLAAYPELGCENKEVKVATKWGVFDDVLCPTEATFTFLNNVFDEVMALFPSQYVHIGGDECPKTAWKNSAFCQNLMRKEGLSNEYELQSYFIKRVEKHINSRGKKIIGWDEILEGGLAPNSTVMSWRGVKGGIEAANEGHPVIMTPTSHCYFDHYQATGDDEPLAIGGFTSVEKVYNWSVIPEGLAADKHQYILGGQANVWTEYIPTFDKVEYMALARMITLSEVLNGRKSDDLTSFYHSLIKHIEYWNTQGTNIANHLFDPALTIAQTDTGLMLQTKKRLPEVTFTIKTPGENKYTPMTDSYLLSTSGVHEVVSHYKNKAKDTAAIVFDRHIGVGADISLAQPPSDVYAGSGDNCIINGIEGSNKKYGGTEWLGFSGRDCIAIIDLKKKETVNSVWVKTFNGEGQWIYLPSEIEVYDMQNPEAPTRLVAMQNITAEGKIARTKLGFDPVETDKLKVVIKNYGKIPEGNQGGGHDSWLFVDELVIR